MYSRVRRLLLSVVLPLVLTAAAPCRAVLPSLSESIEVSIVNVDCVVTDRDGNRVRGLTAEDFWILEQGQVREISNFAEHASSRWKPQPFEIAAAELGEARQSHFTYDVEVRMRNDTNRVAVGVVDEVSGSYAVVRVPVERESP